MSGGQVFDRSSLRQARGAALARNWWGLVLRGVLAVLLGVFAFVEPASALGTIVLVAGIYALVDGVIALVTAARGAGHGRWGQLLLEGVAGVALGLVAILLPAITIVVWIWIFAAWAIVTGALMMAAAFDLHRHHGNWLLGLGGLVSLVWGVLLASWPIAGALVLTLWLGAYALLFGITMIALGLRLRARHRTDPYPAL